MLESTHRSGGGDPESDVLLSTAKRYRIDAEKVHKAVAQEFVVKEKKKRRNPLLIRARP